MGGSIAGIALACVLVGSSVGQSCDSIEVGTLGGSYVGVDTEDGLVYLLQYERGLVIVDTSDPANPVERSVTPDHVGGDCLAISGNIAIVGGDDGFEVFDVSNPDDPLSLTIEHDLAWGVDDIWFEGQRACMLVDVYGVMTFNLADPTAPRRRGVIGVRGPETGLAVEHSIAFVSAWDYGVTILDISRLASIETLSVIETPGRSLDVAVSGGFAYVGNSEGLQVIDARDPEHPVLVASIETEFQVRAVEVAGDTVYAGFGAGMIVVDVSTPAQPSVIATLPETIGSIDLRADGDLLHAAGGARGYRVIDVKKPDAPVPIGGFPLPLEPPLIEAVGDYLYAISEDGELFTVDISNPSCPTVLNNLRLPIGFPSGLAVGDQSLIVSSNDFNPQTPAFVLVDINHGVADSMYEPVTLIDEGGAVEMQGSIAFVADRWDLSILDVSDPEYPALLSTIDTGMGTVQAIALSDGLVGLIGRIWSPASDALLLVDVRDPSEPIIRGTLTGLSSPVDLVFSDAGSLAFIADENRGLVIADIRDEDAPIHLADLDVGGRAKQISADGATVILTSRVEGVYTIGVADPTQPVLKSHLAEPVSFNPGVTFSGSNVCISSKSPAITVLDMRACGIGGCNQADLTAPLGELDPSDLLAFVQMFTDHIWRADLTGDGLFALDDILFFLALFEQGCPR